MLTAVNSTVPSVRDHWGRGRTARRRPSEGRTETAPSFGGRTGTDGKDSRRRHVAVLGRPQQSPADIHWWRNSEAVNRVEPYQPSNFTHTMLVSEPWRALREYHYVLQTLSITIVSPVSSLIEHLYAWCQPKTGCQPGTDDIGRWRCFRRPRQSPAVIAVLIK